MVFLHWIWTRILALIAENPYDLPDADYYMPPHTRYIWGARRNIYVRIKRLDCNTPLGWEEIAEDTIEEPTGPSWCDHWTHIEVVLVIGRCAKLCHFCRKTCPPGSQEAGTLVPISEGTLDLRVEKDQRAIGVFLECVKVSVLIDCDRKWVRTLRDAVRQPVGLDVSYKRIMGEG